MWFWNIVRPTLTCTEMQHAHFNLQNNMWLRDSRQTDNSCIMQWIHYIIQNSTQHSNQNIFNGMNSLCGSKELQTSLHMLEGVDVEATLCQHYPFVNVCVCVKGWKVAGWSEEKRWEKYEERGRKGVEECERGITARLAKGGFKTQPIWLRFRPVTVCMHVRFSACV